MNSKTPLERCLADEISSGKFAELIGVPRHVGDDILVVAWGLKERLRLLGVRSVRMELQLRAATEFINSFSVSNSCECHTCRAMRKYNETIKQLEQQ